MTSDKLKIRATVWLEKQNTIFPLTSCVIDAEIVAKLPGETLITLYQKLTKQLKTCNLEYILAN